MNNLVKAGSLSPQRIERFQSLQAGRYWKALVGLADEHIAEGTVLLLQSIRYVDDKPHTIILRAHPSHYGESVKVPFDKTDLSRGYRFKKLTEHRFLLDEFLQNFQYEPDAAAIRATEAKNVQGRIALLQNELLDAQAHPERMAELIEARLQNDVENSDEREPQDRNSEISRQTTPGAAAIVPVSSAQLSTLATGSVAVALEQNINEEMIGSLKSAASREHRIATIKANWIKEKTAEISETLLALTPFFEEQAAAALAQTEDVRTHVDKIMQGIGSLDLYIGKGVEVETICEGPGAAAQEPLVLMQRKLMMDEELALWADVDESFDFKDEKLFFDTLREQPGLIAQIFPSPRCVIMMAVTRRLIDYKDPWVNAAKNAENRKVFLLVRNGANIHRIFSPVESHLGAARLFPSADERNRIFTGIDGRTIKFEDVAYTDKLSEHEVHALHYKRLLILLAGLDHRLRLFGDFYPGEASLSFVSMDFQQKYLRFVFDEGSNVLGSALPSLAAWIAEKNAYLRPGSRVLCYWPNLMNTDTAPVVFTKPSYGQRRSSAHQVYRPKSHFDVLRVQKSGTDLAVVIPVSGYSFARSAERTFNCHVNLSKFDTFDAASLAYLCLDAVSPQELARYLQSRENRTDHVFYIRFFKHALAFVQAERDEERPARDALLAALIEGNIAAGKDALNLIDQAVRAWRAENMGAALPSAMDPASRNWRALLDQLYALANQDNDWVSKIEELSEHEHIIPLRLVLSADTRYVLYAAPCEAEQDNRLQAHAWVWRGTVEESKTRLSFKARKWVKLPKAMAAETTLHEWPEAALWAERPSAFASLKAKADYLEYAAEIEERLTAVSRLNVQTFDQYYKDWLEARQLANKTSRIVINPRFAVPFGLSISKDGLSAQYLCVEVDKPHVLLYRLAPSDAHRERLKSEFLRLYRNKTRAAELFEENLAVDELFTLMRVSIALRKDAIGGFFSESKTLHCQHITATDTPDPRLATLLAGWKGAHADRKIWLSEPVERSEGKVLDTLLGIHLPPDYAPVKVFEIVRRRDADKSKHRYTRWFDIVSVSDERDPIAEEGNFSVYTTLSINRKEALEKIKATLANESISEDRLVAAAVRTDVPEVPKSVERWYVIDEALKHE